MEKRIELEKRGRSPDAIKELNLDNCRSSSIVGLDDSFVNLEVLSLINVGLANLKGFPTLPNLKRLELSDNRIMNGLEHLQGSTKLEYLNLCGNRIKDLSDLEPLKELKNLQILDLYHCEVTDRENYREFVFNLIPNLRYLDGYDRNNREIEEEDEEDNEDQDGSEDDCQVDGIIEDEEDEEEDADEEDEEIDEEDDDEEEEDVGLAYLAGEKVDEEEEGAEEFVPDEDEEDDLYLDEEEDGFVETSGVQESKGQKRKIPEGDEADEAEAEAE